MPSLVDEESDDEYKETSDIYISDLHEDDMKVFIVLMKRMTVKLNHIDIILKVAYFLTDSLDLYWGR